MAVAHHAAHVEIFNADPLICPGQVVALCEASRRIFDILACNLASLRLARSRLRDCRCLRDSLLTADAVREAAFDPKGDRRPRRINKRTPFDHRVRAGEQPGSVRLQVGEGSPVNFLRAEKVIAQQEINRDTRRDQA